jgi:hypothetical protein
MSDKAEELAKQLLEKTEGGKLSWRFVPAAADGNWPDTQEYRTDLEDGFSFSISRNANGDNKILAFELTQLGRMVLSAQADNFPIFLQTPEPGFDSGKPSEPPIIHSKIARFRLFSDLFRAARKNAVVEDQTIEKVQQLLERLG